LIHKDLGDATLAIKAWLILGWSGDGANLVTFSPAAPFLRFSQMRDRAVRGRRTRAGEDRRLRSSRHVPCKSSAAPLDQLFTPR
jgi:hypothetical protein